MANENQFQSQRPLISPQQVINLPQQQNRGFFANIPGMLDVANGISNMISGGSPADKLNLAQAKSIEDATMRQGVDMVAKAEPKRRRELANAAGLGNPRLKEFFDNLDDEALANLDSKDFAKQTGLDEFRNMYAQGQNIAAGGVDPNNAQQQEPTGANGDGQRTAGNGQAVLNGGDPGNAGYQQPNWGEWANTEVAPQPTQVYSGQGEPPVPDEQYLTGTQDPQAQGPNYQDTLEPPAPTEVTIDPEGEVYQEDPNIARITAVSQESGIPPERFRVSSDTGDIKLKPEYVNDYPHLGPAAFSDVLAAGPEDPIIRGVVTSHVDSIIDSQVSMMRSGAWVRMARAYELGQQPDNIDLLQYSMDNHAMEIFRGEMQAANIGLGDTITDEDIKVHANNYRIHKDVQAPPEMRVDPSVIASVRYVESLPPLHRKAIVALSDDIYKRGVDAAAAKSLADYHTSSSASNLMNAQTGATNATTRATEVVNDYAIQTERNEIANKKNNIEWQKYIRGEKTTEERAAELNLKKAQTAKYLTETEVLGLKKTAEKNGYDPKIMENALELTGIQQTAANVAASSIQTQLKSYENTRLTYEKELNDMLVKFDDPMANILRSSVSNKELPKEAVAELVRNTTLKERILETRERINALNGKITDTQTALQTANDNLVNMMGDTPAKQLEGMARNLILVSPTAPIYWKEAKAKGSPNPPAAKAFMSIMDYQYPGGIPDILDANGNEFPPEQLAGILVTPAALKQNTQYLESHGVKAGSYRREDVTRAIKDWIEWEHLKKKAMTAKPNPNAEATP